jgi:hypothetical protein
MWALDSVHQGGAKGAVVAASPALVDLWTAFGGAEAYQMLDGMIKQALSASMKKGR